MSAFDHTISWRAEFDGPVEDRSGVRVLEPLLVDARHAVA
jgi:hypothetical protein